MERERSQAKGERSSKRVRETTWDDVVSNTLVNELLKGKKDLIVLFNTDTVKHALSTLADNNILSAPVIEKTSGKFLGFVDSIDIVGYTISVWRHRAAKMESESFDSDDFFQRPISRVLNFSRIDEPVCVTEKHRVKDVIEIFCDPKYHRRLHRVAVIQESKKGASSLINIISQSDIIAFATNYADLLETPTPPPDVEEEEEEEGDKEKKLYVDTPVGDLGVIHATLMVFLDSPLIDALEILYKNRVSGIALVDREFHVSANLSASDLRGMGTNAFKYFTGSTLQFLVKGTKSKLQAPITVTPANTLREVLNMLVMNRVHRVYVTNENGHISGLISQRDLISLLRT